MPTNKEFKDELLASSFFDKYIIKDKNVVAIVIGGSRSTGIVDDSSDFDLRVFTTEDADEVPLESLRWKGIRVHWYYRSVKKLLDIEGKEPIDLFGLALMWKIDPQFPDNIIYRNPAYKSIFDLIVARKHDISRYYFYAHFEALKDYHKLVTSAIYLKPEFYDKKLYQFCLASYYLLGQQYDADFLSAVKRIYVNPTSKEIREEVMRRTRLLGEFISQNPLPATLKSDIESEIDALLQ
jgi:hypothetical protein